MVEYDFFNQHPVPPSYAANTIMADAIRQCIQILSDAQRRCEKLLEDTQTND